MNATLVRHAYLSDVTLGRLYVGGLTLLTLEEPWRPDADGPGGQRREGALKESCVPDGTYTLHPHAGTKWRDTWCLENRRLGVYRSPGDIPAGQPFGRSSILIHSGVSVDSILGCILVGLRIGHDGKRHCVYESTQALAQLRLHLPVGQEHQLTIRPIAGTLEAAA